MDNIDKYLESLADHEEEKAHDYLTPRERLLINAGYRLNWIGDYVANPDIEFELKDLELNSLILTGTTPDWNEVLINKCEKSINKFQELIKTDKKIKNKFKREASYGKEPVLARGPDNERKYKLIDGMHRLVGAIVKGRETISAYVVQNESDHLPHCEAHTIYDLIRGFQKNAYDNKGEVELYYSLKLMARTYGNVVNLLTNRFNSEYVNDDKVQKIIKNVINDING